MTQGRLLKAVIFDLDGTLVDTIPVFLAIVNGMLAERGSDRRLTAAQARPCASFGGLALVEGLLADECGDPAQELAEFRKRYQALPTPPDSLFPGADRLVVRLREAGLRLAICSNKPQHLCEKVLHDLGIAQHFDAIVGSSQALAPKPEPEMLDITLARLGMQASECLLVGDSEVDVALAATRDMVCLFVEHGYGNPGEDLAPGRRFADLPAVENAIFSGQPDGKYSGALLEQPQTVW